MSYVRNGYFYDRNPFRDKLDIFHSFLFSSTPKLCHFENEISKSAIILYATSLDKTVVVDSLLLLVNQIPIRANLCFITIKLILSHFFLQICFHYEEKLTNNKLSLQWDKR